MLQDVAWAFIGLAIYLFAMLGILSTVKALVAGGRDFDNALKCSLEDADTQDDRKVRS